VTEILSIDAASYHADQVADGPTLSASIAKILVNQTPAHAYAAHPKLNPVPVKPETKHEWDIGTAAHTLLLEGYDIAYIVEGYDNWKTNAAKDERDEARTNGMVPLLRKEWEEVCAMVDVARAKIAAFPDSLLTDGKTEATLVWEKDGVACRSRLDHLRDDFTLICDYKTSMSADPTWFSERGIYQNGYEIKMAFYLEAVKAVSGVDAEFVWLVQEKKPPYEFSVVAPGPDVLEVGRQKVRCLASGDWPGYATRIHYAELPGWEDARWLEKVTREGVAV
jgi:hypothetical protein